MLQKQQDYLTKFGNLNTLSRIPDSKGSGKTNKLNESFGSFKEETFAENPKKESPIKPQIFPRRSSEVSEEGARGSGFSELSDCREFRQHKYENGNIYIGEWMDGLRDGHGKMI